MAPLFKLSTETFQWVTLPLNVKYMLGAPSYDDQFDGTYPTMDSLNVRKIYPRNMDTARYQYARPDELTNDDLVVWYHRESDEYSKCGHCFVRYEKNPDFNPKEPMGYQWSRVQVRVSGEVMEHTRQVMCMFCQKP